MRAQRGHTTKREYPTSRLGRAASRLRSRMTMRRCPVLHQQRYSRYTDTHGVWRQLHPRSLLSICVCVCVCFAFGLGLVDRRADAFFTTSSAPVRTHRCPPFRPPSATPPPYIDKVRFLRGCTLTHPERPRGGHKDEHQEFHRTCARCLMMHFFFFFSCVCVVAWRTCVARHAQRGGR